MRVPRIHAPIIVVAGALALASCASGGSSIATVSTAANSTTTTSGGTDSLIIFPGSDLSRAVLTSDDLGKGWRRDNQEVFTDRTKVPVLDPHHWCTEAVDQVATMLDTAAPTGVIVGLRETPARGKSHVVTEQVWSGGDAAEFMTAFADAVTWCDGRSWTDEDGNETTFRGLDAKNLDAENWGATVEVVTRGPAGDYLWTSRMAAVRRGTVVAFIDELDVQPIGASALWTDAQWSWVLAKAVNNIDLGLG